ncbi:MAG: antibiotic biosynthesis monooxygenase [Bacteroidia bacterium]|nr:antibiotic biosynthesis monooxygenase [Bacteroidia bacterium]
MIVRIVKMSFEPEKVDAFLEVFHSAATQIRQFEGCSHLELYRDTLQPNVLFTYSYWENNDCLQLYRNSDLFESTWAKTKVLFNDKPQAWSLNRLYKSKD